ncbi:hypothetical protein JHK82_039773 [Glycine max]|nr:hypothetical protein JHK82_039773 [Glycine max]KAG5121838.1 hypothetical protein JHK84_040178 [Glycine max]
MKPFVSTVNKNYSNLKYSENFHHSSYQEVTNEPSEEYLLPTLRISSDVSKFKVENLRGKRLGVRISRIVSETMRLGM